MILDTSVLYDSLVDAPTSNQSRAVLSSDYSLRSPDLIVVEIAGAITKAVRRGDISASIATRMHEKARRIMPEIEPTEPLIERAFALSLELRHPAADCVFLAQAEVLADVLLTVDDHFLRKLAGTPHAARALHVNDWRP